MNKLLEKYIPIVHLVAETFGSKCEVVLHDFSSPQESVVFTINNDVTGRSIGQSFDHLIKKVLLSQNFKNDCASNYYVCNVPGKIVKSSTAIIRDEENNVIGAFCINIDVTEISNFEKILSNFIGSDHTEHSDSNISTDGVEVVDNIMNIVDKIIDGILVDKDVQTLFREQKIELLSFMNDKGIFMIKGNVEKVAEKMGISKVTVYSYLDEIKKRTAFQATD